MIRRLLPLVPCLLAAALAPNEACSQLTLPGAAPAASEGATVAPAKHRAVSKRPAGTPARRKAEIGTSLAPGVASLAGRSLMLNGKAGLLRISGDDRTATIDKLELAGESVSDPSQGCIVDIVGEKPILATSIGRPDGLERFEADVPACPIAFDVLEGAVLVPPQITACVFKAADCRTAPGGLWGPDGEQLVGEAARIAKERAKAEKTMASAVRAIDDLAKANPEAASLANDQNGFAGQRDELCRDYAKESLHGYCALKATQARAALLEARLDALKAAKPASASEKGRKAKKGSKQP